MDEHECVIGMLCSQDYAEITTLSGLKNYIQTEIVEFNALCRKYGYEKLLRKERSLRDYADKRQKIELTRFDYCPVCGKEIDWVSIRNGVE